MDLLHVHVYTLRDKQTDRQTDRQTKRDRDKAQETDRMGWTEKHTHTER